MSGLARREEETPAQRYRKAAGELERLLRSIVFKAAPPDDGFRLLQAGIVVELMPNVLAQVVRLTYSRPYDRYIRVWYQSPEEDGGEEVDLLCFYTENFPDANFTGHRLGMNMNTAWLEIVRQRLLEVQAQQPQLEQLPPAAPAPEALPAPASTQTQMWPPIARMREFFANGGLADPLAALQRPPATANISIAAPSTNPQVSSAAWQRPSATTTRILPTPVTLQQAATGPHATQRATGAPAASTAPPPTAVETRQLDELHRQTHLLFQEYAELRDAAYAQRDQLDRRLSEQYFIVYPFMQQAAKVFSEQEVRSRITAWADQGCPAPSADEGQSSEPERERIVAESLQLARAIVAELSQTQAQIQERTQMLRRLCEVSGGHQPRAERDERGTPTVRCPRCGAALSEKPPDPRETWVN